MNAQFLSDERIRSAIERRAMGASEGDLRAQIVAATAALPQRQQWRSRLLGDAQPQLRAAVRFSLVVVLLMIAVLVAALAGREMNRTTLGKLGAIAYLAHGDLYVAGPSMESPRLVWDLPAGQSEVRDQVVWIDSENVLLQDWSSFSEGGAVYVVNMSTGAHRELTVGNLVAVSPDRLRAAVVRSEQGGPASDRVEVIEISSGAILGAISGMIPGPAQWSPDGHFILAENPESVYRIDIATGARTVLASGLCCGLLQHFPTWSADGTRVVYVNYHLAATRAECDDRCGTVWSVPAAGGDPTRITSEFGSENWPAMSRDGRWIAFINECPCSDSLTLGLVADTLTIVAPDGSGARALGPDLPLRPRVYDIPTADFSWDPDSNGITYLASAGTLWHVTLDGTATELPGPWITAFARQVTP